MVRVVPLALLALSSGCAHTVNLELEAAPAIQLDSERIAVVARDRECRHIANALIDEINAVNGMRVDPTSSMRVEVVSCSAPTYDLTVVEEVQDADTRRQVQLHGRMHAVVALVSGGGVQAHLIGNSRLGDASRWRQDGVADIVHLRNSVQREMTETIAADLLQQLSPVPTLVKRRVYPNAGHGSARDHHNLAVRAELDGDLAEALTHARAALDSRPSSRAADYVAQLERRVLVAQQQD